MKVQRQSIRMRAIIAITLITAGYLAAFALNISPYLRGPQSWRWAFAIPGFPVRHIVPILVVVIYCLVIGYWLQRTLNPPYHKASITTLILCAILGTPLIQAALLFPESPDIVKPLFYRTISPGASGVFSVGSTITNVTEFLRHYPALMPTFPVHPQRYPPGLAVTFYAVRRLFEAMPVWGITLGFALRPYQCNDLSLMQLSNATLASAIIQMLLPIISGLVILPIYDLSKRALDLKSALWAAALYPIIPSFALWSARWDQFYPLLVCASWASF
ncbi:MAG: hypothetical protein P1S60_02950 [Anaerolineae bacterium]|nr:hypothetical protein [Anaerolineae bacterium]